MITLGIDLAAEPARTGVCRVRWSGGAAEVIEARGDTPATRPAADAPPLDNDELLRLIAGSDATGIDAPFGWPVRFTAALAAWSADGAWPVPWEAEARRDLRLRATDRWLARRPEQPRPPLSVSADTIAVCAMRACALLAALPGPVDRVAGPCFEVYPAGALHTWAIPAAGYKRSAPAREALLDRLGAAVRIGAQDRARCVAGDHVLDALLCALVARAAATGRTIPPPPELAGPAAAEGWIHLPACSPAELAAHGTDPGLSAA